jgi:hypothetical protein
VKRPPGRSKRGSLPPDEPPLLEWTFSDCPQEELSICQSYEYSRSSTLIRETVARLRTGEQDPLTTVVIFVFPINVALWLPKSIWWPQTPYLAIPKEERSKLIQAFSRPETMQSTQSFASLIDPFVDDHLHDITAGGVIPVYVPPGQHLETLKRAFADLLRRDYPDLLQRANRFGVATDSDQIRDNLKFLSVWRLREWGYTAKEAIELAKAHKVETYNNVWAYRKAKAKAQKIIAAMEASLRRLATGLTT